MKKNNRLTFVMFLILTLVFTAVAPVTSIHAARNDSKLRIGLLKLSSSAPIFIGLSKGFFKDEGLDMDVQWFQAAQPIAVATASNKIDIGATGITASLFNMIAGGQKLLIVADKGREYKGFSSSAVVVTTDLWNKGVHKIKDLKGKRLGITQTGSTFHYMIGRLLEAKGLSLNDVELVPLGSIGAVIASLQSKQIDAAIVNEPNTSQAIRDGYAKLITQVGDVIDYQTSAIFFSSDLLKNDRELAIKFLKAYIKSTRYYYDAALTKKPGEHFDEVVDIIAKYTGSPVDNIKAALPYMDRNGKLLSKDIQTQIDWYLSHKMIEQSIDSKDVVDTTLWNEALKQVK